jgi:hypothetical protein
MRIPIALLACSAVAASDHKNDVLLPHFHGIFVSLTATTADWTKDQWLVDIRAMKEVGMDFFVLARTARGEGNATGACPSGTYEAYFSMESPCFREIGSKGGNSTVQNILSAAAELEMGVYLGLSLQTKLTSSHVYPWFDKNRTGAFAHTQFAIAQRLWDIAGSTHTAKVIKGFYTEIEESNSPQWPPHMHDFAQAYLQPLASNIKNLLSPNMTVFASPYSVGNVTRYPDWLPPPDYAAMWEEAFQLAPSFDLLAPQDSVGANGNSLTNATAFLGNLSAASRRQHRQMWANVELFEVWPRTCQWQKSDHCNGRHPAPWTRIKQQLETEAQVIGNAAVFIAWEWYSCLSPNGGKDSQWANVTRANYLAYKRYLAGNG